MNKHLYVVEKQTVLIIYFIQFFESFFYSF